VAVLTEVMCVTWTLDKAKEFNSFSLEGFNFNDTVVVQGVGPLGLAHVIKARMMGAGKIIVTDISDYRPRLAKEFGAQGHSGHGTFPRLIECMGAGMDMLPMITKKIKLDDVPDNIVALQTDRTNCKITCVMS